MLSKSQFVDIPTMGRMGTGWLPPSPDLRDFNENQKEVAELVKNLAFAKSKPPELISSVIDLRQWFSAVENQYSLGSCTAQAVVGIVEYYQRRALGRNIEGSRLFVYKATRNLMQVTGDTGAFLRNAMGAMKLCGVPEERYWPYTDDLVAFDHEPPGFVYSLADNYKAIKYFCHDPIYKNLPGSDVLASVKKYLAAGIPSAFGFWIFPSFGSSENPGEIPYPHNTEKVISGHAVVAAGYNDNKEIVNTASGAKTKGALLIRNSWGIGWGEEGYGWLPYDYVLNHLALDFWSILRMDWVDIQNFDKWGDH